MTIKDYVDVAEKFSFVAIRYRDSTRKEKFDVQCYSGPVLNIPKRLYGLNIEKIRTSRVLECPALYVSEIFE